MKENKNIELLFNSIRKHKTFFSLTVILSVILSATFLIIPFFMKSFIDIIIYGKDINKIYNMAIFFIGLIIISFILNLVNDYVVSKFINITFSLDIRKRLTKILSFINSDYFYKDKLQFSEKDVETNIINDVESFKQIASQTIRFVTELLRLFLLLGVIFYYSKIIALIVFFRIPIYYLIIKLFNPLLLEINDKQRKQYSFIIQNIKNIFISIPYIKTMFLETSTNDKMDKEIIEYSKIQHKSSYQSACLSNILILVNSIFNITIYVVAGHMIINNSMTIGSLVLISNVQSRTVMPLSFFSNFYMQYRSSFPSITRLVNFLSLKTENMYLNVSPKRNNIKEIVTFKKLELKNIYYTYNGTESILKNLNLSLNSGDKIIITGDNMSGKSTLLGILSGLIEFDKGTVSIDNKKISKMDLRKYVTILFQKKEYYNINNFLGSGGEHQLSNLSEIKNINTPIIVLDEPDSNINKKRLNEIYEFFSTNKTIIMVSHKIDYKHLENINGEIKIYSLDEGKLLNTSEVLFEK